MVSIHIEKRMCGMICATLTQNDQRLRMFDVDVIFSEIKWWPFVIISVHILPMKRSKEVLRKSMENLAIFLSWAFPLWTFNSLVGVHFSIRETTNYEKYAAQCLQLLLEEFCQANNSYNDGANGRPVTSRQVTVITSPVATWNSLFFSRKTTVFLASRVALWC